MGVKSEAATRRLYMDFKEIALKELNGEDVSAAVAAIPEDKQKEYMTVSLAVAREEKAKELAAVSGLRKAKADLVDKTGEAKQNEAVESQKRARLEQVDKAKKLFIAKYGPDEKQIALIEEEFKKEDSGKFDAELIVEDFKKAFVKIDPDSFIKAKSDIAQLSKNADVYLANMASGGGSTGGSDNGKQFSPQAYVVVREAAKKGLNLTLEEAEKGLKQGDSWNYSSKK